MRKSESDGQDNWISAAILMLWGLLFLVGTVVNLFAEDFYNALAAAGLSIFFMSAAFFFYREDHNCFDFIFAAQENWQEIQDGAVVKCDGKTLSGTMTVVQFQACISLIFFSTISHSRYYIVGQDRRLLPAALYTLVTVLCGWWSLPSGPYRTIRAIYSNLGGGKRSSLLALLRK